MPNRPNESGVDPITLALSGILLITAWCSWCVIDASRAVINAAEDKDTYVLFVTDDGLKSENQALADRVNNGIEALKSAEGQAWLMMVICGILGACLAVRLIKGTVFATKPPIMKVRAAGPKKS